METETGRKSAMPRVLIIDDSSLVRLYYTGVLEQAGYDIEHALNGIEAMEKVLLNRFDLAIVDVNMPRMDGLSFLRALRRSATEIAALPALVISTEAAEADAADARTAGANFYLIKPVSESDLLRHVALLTGHPT
jgi:two-component system, chemotaxis family, chemotaxis protein CheY